jgi:RNA exonuclease 1
MPSSSTSSSKKYKLFSAEASTSAGVKPVCAFFNSPAGCRNGDNCKFSHELTSAESGTKCKEEKQKKQQPQQHPLQNGVEVSETSSVVSSESEGGAVGGADSGTRLKNTKAVIKMELADDPFGSPSGKYSVQEQDDQQQRKNKKKRKSNNDSSRDVFAAPKHAATAESLNDETPQNNKRQKQAPATKTPPVSASAIAANPTSTKVQDKATSKGGSELTRLLSKLPVASFFIPGSTPPEMAQDSSVIAATPAAAKDKKKTPPAPTSRNDVVSKKEKSANKTDIDTALSAVAQAQALLPTSTDVGKSWKDAVVATRQHVKFESSYDFNRYKDNDNEAGIPSTWIKAKPFGPWCKDNPQAIAIDCEMCETEDPLTGSKNHRALCRLSVVNAEKPDEVLLDTLVKPSWPVTNYRTWVNGITKENLDSVEFTLRHAQAFMMALCSEETVIVGHAVHNDLAALNMEHNVVADSSFLFHAKDSTSATVSLKDAVKSVMGVDMPHTHDSVNDARKALEVVLHWKDKKGKVELVQRTPKKHPHDKNRGNQLFVHRIPKVCKAEHLSNMFQKNTSIEPTEVEEIVFSGDHGKTQVSFKTAGHANLAFDSLDGKAEEDKSGKLQKKVFLRNGDYVRVRKMVYEKRPSSLSTSSDASSSSP